MKYLNNGSINCYFNEHKHLNVNNCRRLFYHCKLINDNGHYPLLWEIDFIIESNIKITLTSKIRNFNFINTAN